MWYVSAIRQTICRRIHSQFHFMWFACPTNATNEAKEKRKRFVFRWCILWDSSKSLSARWAIIYLFIQLFCLLCTFLRSTLVSAPPSGTSTRQRSTFRFADVSVCAVHVVNFSWFASRACIYIVPLSHLQTIACVSLCMCEYETVLSSVNRFSAQLTCFSKKFPNWNSYYYYCYQREYWLLYS